MYIHFDRISIGFLTTYIQFNSNLHAAKIIVSNFNDKSRLVSIIDSLTGVVCGCYAEASIAMSRDTGS